LVCFVWFFCGKNCKLRRVCQTIPIVYFRVKSKQIDIEMEVDQVAASSTIQGAAP